MALGRLIKSAVRKVASSKASGVKKASGAKRSLISKVKAGKGKARGSRGLRGLAAKLSATKKR